ncbi:hypothetical protein CSKR_113940, partial [Clonorchis sinensis]
VRTSSSLQACGLWIFLRILVTAPNVKGKALRLEVVYWETPTKQLQTIGQESKRLKCTLFLKTEHPQASS